MEDLLLAIQSREAFNFVQPPAQNVGFLVFLERWWVKSALMHFRWLGSHLIESQAHGSELVAFARSCKHRFRMALG